MFHDIKQIPRPGMGRRHFLKGLTLGTAGFAAGTVFQPNESHAFLFGGKDKSRVNLIHNTDIRQSAYNAMEPFREEIENGIGDRQVVLKINAGLAAPEYAKNSTHADSIRGVLDFLSEFHDRQVLISEGTAGAVCSVFIGYENYGYMPIEKEYKIAKLIEANDQPYTQKWIHNYGMQPMAINVIDLYMDPNVYLISLAKMKTHNAVVGTYSLKNVVMGSPVCHYKDTKLPKSKRNEKSKMHGGRSPEGFHGHELSYNLFRLAVEGVQPDFSIIDGITAIEGNGPWSGEIVEHGVTVASTDFVAADRVCTELMGIDPKYMKYLEFCGNAGMGNWNMDDIKVTGAKLKDLKMKYKLHKTVEKQVDWINRYHS